MSQQRFMIWNFKCWIFGSDTQCSLVLCEPYLCRRNSQAYRIRYWSFYWPKRRLLGKVYALKDLNQVIKEGGLYFSQWKPIPRDFSSRVWETKSTWDNVPYEGILNLPVELGINPCQHIHLVDFVVVNCPSSYNAIIGRPTLNKIRDVTSTYHLLVKFPTIGRIGVLRGN